MGMQWHLSAWMQAHGVREDELAAAMSVPLPAAWLGPEAPAELTLADLAGLCQALGCQPGDLLSFTPETPEEAAQRHLASNLSFQSFLAYQSAVEEDIEGIP